MKNKVKILSAFIIGVIVSAVSVYAAVTASSITYSNTVSGLKDANGNDVTTVQGAIDALSPKRFCEYKSSTYGDSNNHVSVGTMYECDPGDGVKRNFYILEVRNNEIDLILDRDINLGTSYGTLTWDDAVNYFTNPNVANGDGYAIKNSWTNVLKIDLPSGQAILNIVKPNTYVSKINTSNWFCMKTGEQELGSSQNYCNKTDSSPYAWLSNHIRACTDYGCDEDGGTSAAYGYWVKDLVANVNPTHGWAVVNISAFMGSPISSGYGVRPVITVLKSNLY